MSRPHCKAACNPAVHVCLHVKLLACSIHVLTEVLGCRSFLPEFKPARLLKVLVRHTVAAVVRHRAFTLLWKVMDILCKDTSLVASASKEFVLQLQQHALTPWRLVWCFTKMAQQVRTECSDLLWQAMENNTYHFFLRTHTGSAQ